MTPEEKIILLRAALEKNLPRCGHCGAIATWNIRDYDQSEYACDEHLDSSLRTLGLSRYFANDLPEARLAIAVLAETA